MATASQNVSLHTCHSSSQKAGDAVLHEAAGGSLEQAIVPMEKVEAYLVQQQRQDEASDEQSITVIDLQDTVHKFAGRYQGLVITAAFTPALTDMDINNI